jgi:hypothetical protein
MIRRGARVTVGVVLTIIRRTLQARKRNRSGRKKRTRSAYCSDV